MDLPKSPDQWLTTTEATAYTGYAAAYLRRLAEQQRIQAQKIGRDWLLNYHSLQAYRNAMIALGRKRYNPWRAELANRGKGRRAGSRTEQEEQ